MMMQQSVKNQLIVDLARPVPQNDSISMRNAKRAGRLFIPDVVAIATDSRLSNLVLTLVLGVSSGNEIEFQFEFFSLFSLLQILSLSFVTVYSNCRFVHIRLSFSLSISTCLKRLFPLF